MVKIAKKQLIVLLGLFAIAQTHTALDSSLLSVAAQNRIKSSLQSVFRSKTARILGAALVVGAMAYKPYKMLQQYLRDKAINRLTQEAKVLPQEQSLSEQNTVTKILFAHGLGGSSGCCRAFYQLFPQDAVVDHKNEQMAQRDKKLVSFDFQDAPFDGDTCYSCFAQDRDIEKLLDWYWYIGPSRNSKVALYGLSRGASTIFNFLGTHQPKNVTCAVLESPFDDLETIVQNKLKYIGIGYIPGLRSLVSAYVTPLVTTGYPNLWGHSVFGIYPKDVASKIPKDIPLLFVSSKQDGLIPQQSTQRLFDLLKESGHTMCHNIICNTGEHCDVVLNKANGKVREKIKEFIANPQAFLAAHPGGTTVI